MADQQKDRFVTALREEFAKYWASSKALMTLNDEFVARGWSGEISTTDIDDQNYDIVGLDVANAMGTVAAVDALHAAGHATNISKMIKR